MFCVNLLISMETLFCFHFSCVLCFCTRSEVFVRFLNSICFFFMRLLPPVSWFFSSEPHRISGRYPTGLLGFHFRSRAHPFFVFPVSVGSWCSALATFSLSWFGLRWRFCFVQCCSLTEQATRLRSPFILSLVSLCSQVVFLLELFGSHIGSPWASVDTVSWP
jgi:hypothetical protein